MRGPGAGGGKCRGLDAFAGTRRCGCRFPPCRPCHENRYADFETGGNFRGFEHFARGVALHGWLGPGDSTDHAGRHFHGNRFALIERLPEPCRLRGSSASHHVLASTSYWLYSVSMQTYMGSAKRSRCTPFCPERSVHFVVGLENHLCAEIVQQALEFHAHGGGVRPRGSCIRS